MKNTNETIRKILILHSFGMGDMIMALPFIDQLAQEFPKAKIDFAVSQKIAAFPVKNRPEVHCVYHLPQEPLKLLSIVKKLRHEKYDVAFTTSISIASKTYKLGLVSWLIGAKLRVGETLSGFFPFYQFKQLFDASQHRVISNLNLLSLITDKSYKTESPRLHLSDESIQFAQKFVTNHHLTDSYLIGVHPGCNTVNKSRRWPVAYFIETIKKLRGQNPSLVFLIFGGPDEIEEAKQIAWATNSILFINQSLEKVAALISRCNFFLNTDSGLGHIASCFDIKIFSIFSQGDERKTAPLSPKSIILKKNLPCQPCLHKKKKSCDFDCLKKLTPQDVLPKILQEMDHN